MKFIKALLFFPKTQTSQIKVKKVYIIMNYQGIILIMVSVVYRFIYLHLDWNLFFKERDSLFSSCSMLVNFFLYINSIILNSVWTWMKILWNLISCKCRPLRATTVLIVIKLKCCSQCKNTTSHGVKRIKRRNKN